MPFQLISFIAPMASRTLKAMALESYVLGALIGVYILGKLLKRWFEHIVKYLAVKSRYLMVDQICTLVTIYLLEMKELN